MEKNMIKFIAFSVVFLILIGSVAAENLLVEMDGVARDSDGNLLDGEEISIEHPDGTIYGTSNIVNGYFSVLIGTENSLTASCGDLITIDLKIDGDKIGSTTFTACAAEDNNDLCRVDGTNCMPHQYSETYSVHDNDGGPEYETMKPVDEWFCFLTRTKISCDGGCGGNSCQVYMDGSDWKLKADASQSGNNDDVWCRAICLKFSSIIDGSS